MEKEKAGLTWYKEVLMILVGSIPYAWSLVVIDSINIIPGSVIGISVICNTLLDTPIGVVNLLVNIPIMVIGLFFLGKKAVLYTVAAIIATSSLIDLLVPIFAASGNTSAIFAAVWGGILMGAGAGLILSTNASLAGTTMLGKIILTKFPQMKLGNLLIVLDGVIISCGAFLTRDPMALIYSIIYTVVFMKEIDFILYFAPKMLKQWKAGTANKD